jgi:hypothetical protein
MIVQVLKFITPMQMMMVMGMQQQVTYCVSQLQASLQIVTIVMMRMHSFIPVLQKYVIRLMTIVIL